MERFLYRLSISNHADRFILKGALLFKVWAISEARATRDIDMLMRSSNALNNVVAISTEICSFVPPVDDGMMFDASTVRGTSMQLQREYEGARVQFEARLRPGAGSRSAWSRIRRCCHTRPSGNCLPCSTRLSCAKTQRLSSWDCFSGKVANYGWKRCGK